MKVEKHFPSGYDYTPRCAVPSCAGRLTKKWTSKETAIYAWNRRVGPKLVEIYQFNRVGKGGEGVKVADWRNRRCNHKCKFCRHLGLIPTSGYFWCRAKDKPVDEELHRPFCRLFDLREEDNRG